MLHLTHVHILYTDIDIFLRFTHNQVDHFFLVCFVLRYLAMPLQLALILLFLNYRQLLDSSYSIYEYDQCVGVNTTCSMHNHTRAWRDDENQTEPKKQQIDTEGINSSKKESNPTKETNMDCLVYVDSQLTQYFSLNIVRQQTFISINAILCRAKINSMNTLR